MKLPNWADALGGILSPVTSLIESKLSTADDRAEARAAIDKVQSDVAGLFLGFAATVANAQRDVIVAESGSESWITRTWRPLTMLCFVGLIMYMVIAAPWIDTDRLVTVLGGIPEKLWTIVEIGIGGYVMSRGVEKVAKTAADAWTDIRPSFERPKKWNKYMKEEKE